MSDKEKIRDVIRSNIILQITENLSPEEVEKVFAKALERSSKKEETNATEQSNRD